MKALVQGPAKWWEIETHEGTFFVPFDVVGIEKPELIDFKDFVDVADVGHIQEWELTLGYGARLSAPGYTDCTEWTVFGTENEAREYLFETWNYCPMCLEEIETGGNGVPCACIQNIASDQWVALVQAYVRENVTVDELLDLVGVHEIVSKHYNSTVIDTVHSRMIQEWLDAKKVRCGKCGNCQEIEKVRNRVLACANPPLSHADDGVITLWNTELERLKCSRLEYS